MPATAPRTNNHDFDFFLKRDRLPREAVARAKANGRLLWMLILMSTPALLIAYVIAGIHVYQGGTKGDAAKATPVAVKADSSALPPQHVKAASQPTTASPSLLASTPPTPPPTASKPAEAKAVTPTPALPPQRTEPVPQGSRDAMKPSASSAPAVGLGPLPARPAPQPVYCQPPVYYCAQSPFDHYATPWVVWSSCPVSSRRYFRCR